MYFFWDMWYILYIFSVESLVKLFYDIFVFVVILYGFVVCRGFKLVYSGMYVLDNSI